MAAPPSSWRPKITLPKSDSPWYPRAKHVFAYSAGSCRAYDFASTMVEEFETIDRKGKTTQDIALGDE